MPKKIRDLLSALHAAGFVEIPKAGKGSHRKFIHPNYPGAITVSGQLGDDAKRYQEQQIITAIRSVQ
ncbi:type II toxin-antitoxin system HicA family toxin [Thiospirillum jenense]|uniref:Type II toxin-antitoxin system HicA family toxin n=1 Tax=Thiospirillum jenense TaxID=1653858 RepID=A0A839HJ92_9GAMM|nr:type II toxin-antitoxin system HicA family toxin [Thiospirillum jenense]MBB1127056.1 type II toxin-antitoxin system HicA family toxin [Thiospirillum jenense]